MTDDTKNKKSNTLTVSGRPKLSLTQNVESGQVHQTLHGRSSKTVTVEVRRARNFGQDDKKDSGKSDDGSGLSESEQTKRRDALNRAAQQRTENPTPHHHHIRHDPNVVHDPVVTTSAAAGNPGDRPAQKDRNAATQTPPSDEDIAARDRDRLLRGSRKDFGDTEEAPRVNRARRNEPRRRQGKLTITQALDQTERHRSLASIRRQRDKAKRTAELQDIDKMVRDIIIPETIEVQELANRMAVRSVDVTKELMKLGIMIKTNEPIDADTAELIVTEFGHRPKRVTEGDVENILIDDKDDESALQPRPPVVTIMGHVDHGKTSLLDALRSTDVVSGEAGGITQHIGAYQITVGDGDKITFLDTPGHEAFTAMRARGANVTDIVVLVVAADDGIMPQTEEAISHAKAAKVPIIVAINKIDKPGANPKRVKDALLSFELIPEELGGETIIVEVSAKQKTNLDKLTEAILLQAEVLELKANPNRKASGTVVEAKLDKGRGVVATLLIQKGCLKPGDIVLAGKGYGKVRALVNDKGEVIEQAVASMPVEVLGLNEVPNAGDSFSVVSTDKQARDIVEYRLKKERDLHAAEQNKQSLDNLFQQAGKDAVKELPIILKADVQGSIEAISGSLEKLSQEEVRAKVVYAGVGGITESDINLAMAVKARIIGFNVRANTSAKDLAQKEGINVSYYSIIYNIVDDIRDMLSGMLKPTMREQFLGNAEIMEVFKVSKVGKVAGCVVRDGIVKRGAKVRLIRDNVVIHEGTLKTLKRFNDDASEVKQGLECGMAFEKYDDIKKGDVIEAFEIIKEERKL